MDALVDGMNGFGTDDNFMSNRASTKAGKLPYHPLYQPPLPTPPPGVVLGGGKPRKSGKSSKSSPKNKRRSYSADEDDDSPQPSQPSESRSPRPATSRTGSTATVTPDSHPLVEFPASVPSMDEILEKHIQATKPKTVVPSISEIIRKHAPPTSSTRTRPSLSRTSSSYGPKSVAHSIIEEPEPGSTTEDADLVSRSSVDSVAAEVQQTLLLPALHHAHSFPNQNSYILNDPLRTPTSERQREPSLYSSSGHSGAPPPPSPLDLDILPKSMNEPSHAIATYLRSTRLTTLLKLTRSPHASRDRPLTVSLSDLGSPTGHPLVVFLGLGCVRHIMGLYDEMAECLGLRLITIDRWGLGRTGQARSKGAKGIPEWASVVAEVLDRLKISKCSVMAHSAGAPYALSFANTFPDRIHGDLCLLAPWVGGGESSGYKWLKYVPNGLLRTAQAAEWKVQAWMIGKPPKIAFEGIGYSVKAPVASSPELPRRMSRSLNRGDVQRGLGSHPPSVYTYGRGPAASRQSMASSKSTSSYDDLRDFDGRFESRSTLGARPSNVKDKDRPQTASAGEPKRKTSSGFLGRFRPASLKQQGTPTKPTSPNIQHGSGRTLRALRSIGSLKGKSSTTPPASLSKVTSPVLPQPAEFDGLGIDLDGALANAIKQAEEKPELSITIGTPTPTPSRPTTARAAGGRSISFGASMRSTVSSVPSVPPSPAISVASAPSSPYAASTAYQAALGNALIAASHAESAKGTHGDLLQILNHDERPWGFSYHAYPHRVRVWYGDRDEKIAEDAVRWMERNMGEDRCGVKVVKGADHGLMYNSAVVVEVLEKIADGWKEGMPRGDVFRELGSMS
ncbi:hypothetical protein PUNSTDRAFT_109725 [Punctularia strigosozonata HHB-11173 SS5]|uniref:uncharacterized protein n=1 Tax=Punctularia strigosozonata (strain HHB-11173) TaxID=741275 RepID=UPI0004417D69|nr:uncharacterized protein PUNSTDRAFT_109725 [Punctularia strigosozonata HHB-11173 SS5]EIN13527.1 hypothetical protein PUNSTDRAFT_109725 [Punctularia strigosozonata HHB-11173 SS5]